MAIKYVLAQRANPKDITAPRKFYAMAKSHGEESIHQLSKEVSKRSGLSSSEVSAVLKTFIDLIPEKIAEGKIVRLGDFGSFYLTVQSEGVDNVEEFEVAKIKGNKLNFRSGKIVQETLKTVNYRKIEEL